MPPADPREYAIIRDLQAALQAVTVAGGYHYTIATGAVKLDPNHEVESLVAPDGPRPFVILEPKPDTFDFDDARSGEVVVTIPMTVHWFHDTDPTDDADLLDTYYRGCADVEVALTQDITRGARAVDTRITSRSLDLSSDAARVWAHLEIEVRIWRTYGAPNGA